uniref:3-deoxy-D-manno-octulosonate 8-phosphate phosphatase KdsC n=1 Tax=uncultured Thiotrichaceae bacterium TaxID=298394 RepID=A0A6S6RTQ9_9GAMM|nr:MAG: 3-deoxy-D-manno-octulosonate 8-phosphate phosphatase (EC [uncultured Thiotrichaceae bacterium]
MDLVRKKASQIKLIIFDVDGVLTDGSLYFDNQGQEYKAFNAKDGHGMRMLMDSGIKVSIITGRKSELVLHRADNLRIPREFIFQGCADKRVAFAELCQQTGIKPEHVAYVGDDVIDLPVMSKVGLPIAVADALDVVKQHADWITDNPGGKGAAREVCDMLLDAQGKLDDLIAGYLA